MHFYVVTWWVHSLYNGLRVAAVSIVCWVPRTCSVWWISVTVQQACPGDSPHCFGRRYVQIEGSTADSNLDPAQLHPSGKQRAHSQHRSCGTGHTPRQRDLDARVPVGWNVRKRKSYEYRKEFGPLGPQPFKNCAGLSSERNCRAGKNYIFRSKKETTFYCTCMCKSSHAVCPRP